MKGRLITRAFLLAAAFVTFFPLYWILITSFKTQLDIVVNPTYLPWADFMPTLEGWKWLLTEARADVIRAITNSLIVSGGSAVIATMLGAAAGYGLTRFQYRWRFWRNEDIAFWFISQRMLPPVAIVLAFLLMFRYLSLLDTQVGLTIAYTGFAIPFTVWIMRDAFAQVPLELEESAGVDGASAAGIFFRISLPLALPGVVGSMLFAFVFAWNEYLFALMLTFQEATTVPLLLASRITSFGTHWDQLSALTLTNLIPAAILGIMLERFLIRNRTEGSLK
ncbi:MAG: carbohydrate ABC transporter permease [bacterium]|nr:carbohydrate ABC transporter permease [bacterium]